MVRPRLDTERTRDTLHRFQTCPTNAELRIWFCFHPMSGEVSANLDVGRELIVRPQTVKAVEEGFDGVVGRHHQSLEPAHALRRTPVCSHAADEPALLFSADCGG